MGFLIIPFVTFEPCVMFYISAISRLDAIEVDSDPTSPNRQQTDIS